MEIRKFLSGHDQFMAFVNNIYYLVFSLLNNPLIFVVALQAYQITLVINNKTHTIGCM